MSSRTAFITGASRGIGKACALALSAAGYRVVLAARALDKLEEVAASIRAQGREAFVVELDLASQDSIKNAFAKAAKEFGRIDVLVNNAGVTKDGLAIRMKREDFESVIQTNLTGAFLCCQQVLLAMMKERYGRIINISSIVGETGNAGQANYVSSKAGLIGLTKALAQERSRTGLYRYGHDGDSAERRQGSHVESHPAEAPWNRRGHCVSRGLPGKRAVRIHHRACARRQWWDVYVAL
jgi:3-oxoacyl-[acyl-carrier protein] reductase